MEQAITAGNKTIVVRRRAATNRVSSQALERKNGLNTFSALRTVVTQNAGNASKQTERADKMRRVHPTYTGYICVAQSADTGENVGMRKQLAITAGVCTAGEALPLKLRLLADPPSPRSTASRAATSSAAAASPASYVNGEWIGVCATPTSSSPATAPSAARGASSTPTRRSTGTPSPTRSSSGSTSAASAAPSSSSTTTSPSTTRPCRARHAFEKKGGRTSTASSSPTRPVTPSASTLGSAGAGAGAASAGGTFLELTPK